MKKAILILFIFISCYFIYNYTIDNKLFYLNIGDGLAMGINNNNAVSEGYSGKLKHYLEQEKLLSGYNESFTNMDYRITDIINCIKFHEKVLINNDEFTIDELLKKADVVTVSVGMNELYYKLLLNNDNIYGYIDNMLKDISQLLDEISKYNNQKVFVLGYYNITNTNYDVFTYLNYNMKTIVDDKKFIFIDLNKIFKNNNIYFNNSNIIYPNNEGYNKIFQIIVDKI